MLWREPTYLGTADGRTSSVLQGIFLCDLLAPLFLGQAQLLLARRVIGAIRRRPVAGASRVVVPRCSIRDQRGAGTEARARAATMFQTR